LGLIVWIFLVVIAVIDLRNKKVEKMYKVLLFAIGIVGIILDSTLLALGFFWNLSAGWMFDILGLFVFPFIMFVAYRDLKDKKIKRPMWTKKVLMAVGILGLIADLFVLLLNLL